MEEKSKKGTILKRRLISKNLFVILSVFLFAGLSSAYKVNLYENLLTEAPNDYSAKVISERSLGVADICNAAANCAKAPTAPKAMEHNVQGFTMKKFAIREFIIRSFRSCELIPNTININYQFINLSIFKIIFLQTKFSFYVESQIKIEECDCDSNLPRRNYNVCFV